MSDLARRRRERPEAVCLRVPLLRLPLAWMSTKDRPATPPRPVAPSPSRPAVIGVAGRDPALSTVPHVEPDATCDYDPAWLTPHPRRARAAGRSVVRFTWLDRRRRSTRHAEAGVLGVRRHWKSGDLKTLEDRAFWEQLAQIPASPLLGEAFV